MYAQDSWRLRDNLTLNAGLRYEYFTPLLDRNNLLTNIDPATGQIVTAQDRQHPRARAHRAGSQRLRAAGRHGLDADAASRCARRLRDLLSADRSLRQRRVSSVSTCRSSSTSAINANSGAEAPAFTFSAGLHAAQRRATSNPARRPVAHPGSRIRRRRSSISSASVRSSRSAPTWWPRVDYVGNRTRNGRRLRNLNEGIIQTPGVGPVVYPYAQYGFGNAFLEQIVTNGRADYNALQTRMQRRMSDGLAFTVAYTWSKAPRAISSITSAPAAAHRQLPEYHLRAWTTTTARCAFDVPHRLSRPASSTSCRSAPAGRFSPAGALGVDRRATGR